MKSFRLPRLLIALIFVTVSTRAPAIPWEFTYTGQITSVAGDPLGTLDEGAPAGSIGGLRITFWDSAWNGGSAPQTPPGAEKSAELLFAAGDDPLTVRGTFLTSCVPGAFALPKCLEIATGAQGLYQIPIHMTPAQFHSVFSDSPAPTYIQTERVYFDRSSGAVTSVFYFPRQRFTMAPYCLKVPVDGATVTYDANGRLMVRAGGITDDLLASTGITTPGKVSGNAIISGTIGGSTSFDTSGNVSAGAGAFTTSLTVRGLPVAAGTGTANNLVKWGPTGNLTNSVMIESGGNIGIGTGSPVAPLDVTGFLLRRVYRATGQSETATTIGPLTGRSLTFTKLRATTSVRIDYTDSRRTMGTNVACRWHVRVDGAACPTGFPLVYDHFDGTNNNTIVSANVMGFCDGLAAGSHTILIYTESPPGFTAATTVCYTGYRGTTWSITAEEVY